MKLVIGILIIFVLIACAPEPIPAPIIQEAKVGTPTITSEIPKEQTPEVIIETIPLPAISAEAQALLQKNSKIKNYRYTTKEGIIFNDVETNTIKIDFYNSFKGSNNFYYNFALINRDTNTVHAWCERTTCDEDTTGKAYRIDYAPFLQITTPMDIIASLTRAELLTGKTRIIENYEAQAISITSMENKTGVLWLYSYYGMPLELTLDEVVFKYKDMAINPPLWEPLIVPAQFKVVEG